MTPTPRHRLVYLVKADPHLWDQTDPDGSPRYFVVHDHHGVTLGYASKHEDAEGNPVWSTSALGRPGHGPNFPTLEAAAKWVATNAAPPLPH